MEDLLKECLREARTAWPGVDVDAGRFLAHLAERLPPDRDLAAGLRELRVTDLYLACGCVAQDRMALDAFDRGILSQVPRHLAGLRLPKVLVEEVVQLLRVKLLVADPGAAPKIADYAGRGSLGGWVRSAALRAGRDLLRQQGVQHAGEHAAAHEPQAPRPAMEDEHLRGRYQEEFRKALGQALADLPEEQRGILRMHFMEGLKMDQIAARLGVNKSTVSRRISAACDAVMEEAQRIMQGRLGLGEREMESIIGLLRSQLHLSLSQALGAG